MLRGLILASCLAASACAPGPAPMAATEASEVLARFAGGAAPANVCTPEGRSLLRGAVRAYGRAMALAGETWPRAVDDGAGVASVDAMVMVAAASGVIEPSDLRVAPTLEFMPIQNWPAPNTFRRAATVACGELMALQDAAARYVREHARYLTLSARAERGDARARLQAERQSRRRDGALADVRALNELVGARVAAES